MRKHPVWTSAPDRYRGRVNGRSAIAGPTRPIHPITNTPKTTMANKISTPDDNLKEDIVLDAIEETRGRFFGVTFEKKDGTTRHMNARTHPDDNPPHWDPEAQGMKLVWDVQEGGFRTITAKSVTRFTFASKTIMFD